MNYRLCGFALGLLASGLIAPACLAQQDAGDKELGIGGLVSFNHSSDFQGNAFAQFTGGYFKSKKDYFGVELDPIFSFSHSQGSNSVTVGGFFLGNYRRFLGRGTGKMFPFVGGGGGGQIEGTIGSGAGASGNGVWFAEAGLKNYVSQKTSLEFDYKFMYVTGGGGGFGQSTMSLFTVSIRHIF